MGFIAFIIIGLLAGLVARAVMPGRQNMGFVSTTLLGIVGSFVGGLIGALFEPGRGVFELHPSGIILSILGAVIVLAVTGYVGRRHLPV